MRALVFVALTACGGAQGPSVDSPRLASSSFVDGGAPDAPVDSLPSFAELASRAPEVAPGMRELARGESTHAELVHSAASDTCIRVAFAADAPVNVHVESSSGIALSRTTDASLSGVVAPRGPVCVRRGDGARVSFDGAAGARVRWIAWGAP